MRKKGNVKKNQNKRKQQQHQKQTNIQTKKKKPGSRDLSALKWQLRKGNNQRIRKTIHNMNNTGKISCDKRIYGQAFQALQEQKMPM